MSSLPPEDRFADVEPDVPRETTGDVLDQPSSAPPLRVVLLDVNGTLTDTAHLAAAFERVGAPGALAATWFAAVLRDGFALALHGDGPRFADVARAGARTALAGAGVPPERLEEASLAVVEAVGALPLHPDVVTGLAVLRRRGLRLVPLSQGAAAVTDRLLAAGGAAGSVEAALSVADAPGGLWKPVASTYRWALDQAGAAPEEALLVAAHPWDLDGAARVGIGTAWLDRPTAAGDGRTPWPAVLPEPDLVVPGLDALADVLR